MKKKIKENFFIILYYIFIVLTLNLVVTSTIDSFKHPDQTRTRTFLRIPQTYLWNFIDTKK